MNGRWRCILYYVLITVPDCRDAMGCDHNLVSKKVCLKCKYLVHLGRGAGTWVDSDFRHAARKNRTEDRLALDSNQKRFQLYTCARRKELSWICTQFGQ